MKAVEGSSEMVPFPGAFETALILDVAEVGGVVPGMISSKEFQETLLDENVLDQRICLVGLMVCSRS